MLAGKGKFEKRFPQQSSPDGTAMPAQGRTVLPNFFKAPIELLSSSELNRPATSVNFDDDVPSSSEFQLLVVSISIVAAGWIVRVRSSDLLWIRFICLDSSRTGELVKESFLL